MGDIRAVTPIPCLHLYDYYNWLWEQNHCIAWNLLRRGYFQCAVGMIRLPENNLYDLTETT